MIPASFSVGESPYQKLDLDLSESDLRETAYEILIGACQNSDVTKCDRSEGFRVLGVSFGRKCSGLGSGPGRVSIGERMRVQMKISVESGCRVREGPIESIVLPVELMQQYKSSDFQTQDEYHEWQTRNLKILEVGLLLHPRIPLDKKELHARQLSEIIFGAYECPMVTGKDSEEVETLRAVALPLALRSFYGNCSDACHWADGVPLNLRLYQVLLEALFDVDRPSVIINEVDEMLEFIKRTWGMLGLDQRFHNICFLWVLFSRFISTGQVANDLLFACANLMLEVKDDADSAYDSDYSKILHSTLTLMLDWADKRLFAYREFFYRGNIDLMNIVLSIGLSAAEIVGEERNTFDLASTKVETYIRSSMRRAFSQGLEKLCSSRRSTKGQQTNFNQLPALCMIAQEIIDLAFTEKEIYSPILEKWHPLAVGVAVATLHSCYGQQVKAFTSEINDLTPSVIQVLIAADKLEKCLVQMAVEASFNSEDGGKSIIQEMTPFEVETVISDLVKSWIRTRVDRLAEWVDRSLKKEVWNPMVNKGRFTPTAEEVLRTISDTLEAFFLLPIPMHVALLPDLTNGLDRCLQDYILKAKSGSGTRSNFLPKLPSLTRCSGKTKTNGVFGENNQSQVVEKRKLSTEGDDDSYGIPQLCVRVNTFLYIRKELEVLEKKVITQLNSTGLTHEDSIVNDYRITFKLSLAACQDGTQEICEVIAYKVVFHKLNRVLWDGLYVGEVSSSRIEPFLQELKQHLEKIAKSIDNDIVRTKVTTDIMRASYDGFLLVLLAGGPSRNFTHEDSSMIKQDFHLLVDLFWAHGDGLPIELINKFSATVEGILPLFATDTESLIERFKSLVVDNNDLFALPPPLTSGQWDPNEPNTVLRVLCHRNDNVASKFLKEKFDLPKKLF
ncbi:protein unc-13 homolog isoform X1 [Tanacetum coccineum]